MLQTDFIFLFFCFFDMAIFISHRDNLIGFSCHKIWVTIKHYPCLERVGFYVTFSFVFLTCLPTVTSMFQWPCVIQIKTATRPMRALKKRWSWSLVPGPWKSTKPKKNIVKIWPTRKFMATLDPKLAIVTLSHKHSDLLISCLTLSSSNNIHWLLSFVVPQILSKPYWNMWCSLLQYEVQF